MQISLYIGARKKKDKIVNEELLKYIEGDRSDRIKDLILKGLIFEGKRNIDENLLDMRYAYSNHFTAATIEERPVVEVFAKAPVIASKNIESGKPDFSKIKVKRKKVIDDDLENRI